MKKTHNTNVSYIYTRWQQSSAKKLKMPVYAIYVVRIRILPYCRCFTIVETYSALKDLVQIPECR